MRLVLLQPMAVCAGLGRLAGGFGAHGTCGTTGGHTRDAYHHERQPVSSQVWHYPAMSLIATCPLISQKRTNPTPLADSEFVTSPHPIARLPRYGTARGKKKKSALTIDRAEIVEGARRLKDTLEVGHAPEKSVGQLCGLWQPCGLPISGLSRRKRAAQRRQQLRPIERLLQDGGDLFRQSWQYCITRDNDDADALIVQLVDQAVGQFALEIDVYNSKVGLLLSRKPACV